MSHYYLSVCSVFKNESWGMKEWIEHNRYHGVDHIYLVDDESDDDYMKILGQYIDSGYVTLFQNDIHDRYVGRQIDINNKYFLPILNETMWIANIDLDEYLYSPKEIDIRNILRKSEDVGVINVDWVWMNSCGHITHPKGIVRSFTKRCEHKREVSFDISGHGPMKTHLSGIKCIANTRFKIESFQIHHIAAAGSACNLSLGSDENNPDLLINHYQIQSREYWEKVKMRRGDVNFWFKGVDRKFEEFEAMDVGDIDDFRLRDQNYGLDF